MVGRMRVRVRVRDRVWGCVSGGECIVRWESMQWGGGKMMTKAKVLVCILRGWVELIAKGYTQRVCMIASTRLKLPTGLTNSLQVSVSKFDVVVIDEAAQALEVTATSRSDK